MYMQNLAINEKPISLSQTYKTSVLNFMNKKKPKDASYPKHLYKYFKQYLKYYTQNMCTM